MGLMTGSGCLSRVMGPVFVTHIYEECGTVWTFGMTTVMMILCLLWLLYFNKSLIPVEVVVNPEDGQELQEVDKFLSNGENHTDSNKLIGNQQIEQGKESGVK